MPKNLPLQVISLLLSAGLLTILWNLLEKYVSFRYHRAEKQNKIILENIFISFYSQIEKFLFSFPTVEKIYEIPQHHQRLKNFLEFLDKNPNIKFYLSPKLIFVAHECCDSIENCMRKANYGSYSYAKTNYMKFSRQYLKELNKIRKSEGLPRYGYQYRKYNSLYSCSTLFFPIVYWGEQITRIVIKLFISYIIALFGLLILILLFIKIYTTLINSGVIH